MWIRFLLCRLTKAKHQRWDKKVETVGGYSGNKENWHFFVAISNCFSWQSFFFLAVLALSSLGEGWTTGFLTSNVLAFSTKPAIPVRGGHFLFSKGGLYSSGGGGMNIWSTGLGRKCAMMAEGSVGGWVWLPVGSSRSPLSSAEVLFRRDTPLLIWYNNMTVNEQGKTPLVHPTSPACQGGLRVYTVRVFILYNCPQRRVRREGKGKGREAWWLRQIPTWGTPVRRRTWENQNKTPDTWLFCVCTMCVHVSTHGKRTAIVISPLPKHNVLRVRVLKNENSDPFSKLGKDYQTKSLRATIDQNK